MIAQFQAYMDRITTMKDKSVKVTLVSQELSADSARVLFDMRNQLGWALFSANSITENDVPTEQPTEFKNDKTPSSRLRNTLFVYWKQSGGHGVFEDFYRQQMEVFIEQVKEKLA